MKVTVRCERLIRRASERAGARTEFASACWTRSRGLREISTGSSKFQQLDTGHAQRRNWAGAGDQPGTDHLLLQGDATGERVGAGIDVQRAASAETRSEPLRRR